MGGNTVQHGIKKVPDNTDELGKTKEMEMKHKYIDELVGRYYIFPEGEDKSDIAT